MNGKRNFLCLILLLSSFVVQAQNSNTDQNITNELTILTPYSVSNSTIIQTPRFTHLIPTLASLYTRTSDKNFPYTPFLASGDPKVSNDGKTYTITLKNNLQFSNGQPLTAADVVFSYNVVLTPALSKSHSPAPTYDEFTTYFDSNASIVQIDDITVEFNLNQPYILAMEFFLLNIFDKEVYVDLYNSCVSGVKADCDWNRPNLYVTAGPYMLDNFDEDASKWTLVKNQNFFDANHVYGDKIYVQTEENFVNAQSMLINGDADIIHWDLVSEGFHHNLTEYQQAVQSASVISTPYYLTINFIGLNQLHPYFGTGEKIPNGGVTNNDFEQARLLRTAMASIVDYDTYANVIESGVSQPATSLVVKDTAGYNSKLSPRAFSISHAKALMEDAGFNYSTIVDSNSDGDWGDENDTSFFKINLLVPDNNPDRITYFNLYADALEKIGIKANRTEPSFIDLVKRVYLNQDPDHIPLYKDGGYDIFFVGTDEELELPPSTATTFHSKGECLFSTSENTRCANTLNYSNATMDAKLEEFIQEVDYDKRVAIMQEVQSIEYETLPDIPLLYGAVNYLINNHVTGFNSALAVSGIQQWTNITRDDWVFPNTDSNHKDTLPTVAIIGGVAGLAIIAGISIRKVLR